MFQLLSKLDGSGFVSIPIVRDELSLRLLEDFASASKANPDSIRSLGADQRSRILAFYASRIVLGDPAYAGLPGNLPVGISSDRLNLSLVQVAARSGLGWARIAATGSGLDSIQIFVIAQDLQRKGLISALEVSLLKNRTESARPDTAATPGVVATPSVWPAPGMYTKAIRGGVSCATLGAVIHFTVDGSIPTEFSPIYTDSILVNQTATIRAIAVKSGLQTSGLMNANFTITGKVSAPLASLAAGPYSNARKVALATATPDAEIHYTTDGSAPTGASPIFKDSVLVDVSMTIRAIGLKSGWESSNVSDYVYSISSTNLGASYQIALEQLAADSAAAARVYGIHEFRNKASSTELAVDSGRVVFRAKLASDGTEGYSANVGFTVPLRPDGAPMDLSNLAQITFEYKNSDRITDMLTLTFGSDVYPEALVKAGTVHENNLTGASALAAHSTWTAATMSIGEFATPSWWTATSDLPKLAAVLKQVKHVQFAPKTRYSSAGLQGGNTCAMCVGPTMPTLTLEVRNIRFIGR